MLNSNQKNHTHRNCFIPPLLLDNMARAGVESARESIIRSQTTRDRRGTISFVRYLKTNLQEAPLVSTDKGANAAIHIYDIREKMTQRQNLVIWDYGVDTVIQEARPGPEAKEVYAFVKFIRSFMVDNFNRLGIDGKGGKIHVNINFGKSFNNAFWDGDELTLGTGDDRVFTNFSKSIDVIAHEMGHGFVQFISPLEYEGQSGALNEHFADVFGTLIQQYYDSRVKDWLIGNEIMGPDLYGEALRSMAAPGSAYNNKILGSDSQPDHMDDLYKGRKDNGGVHINSGIFNKAFYLVAKEIGTLEAAKVWYDALYFMWPTIEFDDAAMLIIQTARGATRNKTITEGTVQHIRKVFKSIGII